MNALYVRNETSLLVQLTGGFAGEQAAGQTVQRTELRLEAGPQEAEFLSCDKHVLELNMNHFARSRDVKKHI